MDLTCGQLIPAMRIASRRSRVYCAIGANSTRSVGPAQRSCPPASRSPVAQQPHYVEVVETKDSSCRVGLSGLAAVQYHGLHRDIERRSRSSRMINPDATRSRARCRRRLLPAGKLMWKRSSSSIGRPTCSASSLHRARTASRRAGRQGAGLDRQWRAGGERGLRLSVGSWNTI